jgi:palmitoyltransferase
MGTSNVLLWFLPFGGAPSIASTANYEVNGFEDASKIWPPPDPDKMPRAERALNDDMVEMEYETVREEKEAFRRRQEKDYERWGGDLEEESEEYESEYEEGIDGEEGWTNSDGDRLRDYGVDEEAEVLADDEIPLGELLRRRKARAAEL